MPSDSSFVICVDIKNLPLQILLKRHPEWRKDSVAVVKDDKPTGIILSTNLAACKKGIRTGHTYAAALSLDPHLKASAVASAEIKKTLRFLLKTLHHFSMDVESDNAIFWLKTGNTKAIQARLQQEGFDSSVAEESTRFRAYAAAKAPGCEFLKIRLAQLDISPELLEFLTKLNVITLKDYLTLPSGDLLERFGPEARNLHRMASGDLSLPINPTPEKAPLHKTIHLVEAPAENREEILFLIKRLLDPLLLELENRGEGLTRLHLNLFFENKSHHCEILSPASPSLDSALLIDLVRLRIKKIPAPVIEIRVTVEGEPLSSEQLLLFQKSNRDLRAAEEALSRIRSEFGESSVVKAVLRNEHLPEMQFEWAPLDHLAVAQVGPAKIKTFRKIYTRPKLIPPPSLKEKSAILSGGWWNRPYHREYYEIDGDWIYFDVLARRWYLHGKIE